MNLVVKPGYKLTDHDLLFDSNSSQQYVMRVRDLEDQDKPREKLLEIGAKELSLAELIAIILGVGTRKEDVLAMSNRVVREYGERALLNESNPKKLAQALDIPIQKSSQLVASMELGRRFYARNSGKPAYIRTPAQAYELLKNMSTLHKEQLRGLYLNSRFEVIHDEIISVGSLTANIVHPREVFQPAIEHGAMAVIIAHNHPSGDIQATKADVEATKQLRAAGLILGIDLIDHIIVAQDSYISLIEETK